jgi:hypothetical protein
MIDLKILQDELNHARLARLDAEAAESDVEDLIRQVQRFRPGRQRLLFMVEIGEVAPVAAAN